MKRSAGLLVFRAGAGGLEIFLAHPGGPYWRGRDDGAWTLPKGEYVAPEEPLAAALREWEEETGFPPPAGPYAPLGEVTLKSGKRIVAWACAGDADPERLRCNTFEVEWPPKSGRMKAFPEVDRAAWFPLAQARVKIHAGQAPFLDRLAAVSAAAGA